MLGCYHELEIHTFPSTIYFIQINVKMYSSRKSGMIIVIRHKLDSQWSVVEPCLLFVIGMVFFFFEEKPKSYSCQNQ